MQSANQKLSGWGRYPQEECAVFRPESRPELAEVLESGDQSSYIARGLGRSYGDAAINDSGGVVSMVRLDRMLGFDVERGIIECEAGVSLAEILEVFVPRGWFLPVTPGTKFVTVGGAIAHDVHGKNHHREGSFSRYVLDFELLSPEGELIQCSPEDSPDVFWATVGGAGLTGFIISARIQLLPIETAYIRVDYRRCTDLDDVLAAIQETDQKYKYSVAWIDCLAKGKKMGRSVLMSGEHLAANDLPSKYGPPLQLPRRGKPNVPFEFPSILVNPLSVAAFNATVYAMHKTREGEIVDYDKYFYPLDRIHNWNRMYGKKGFTQYQATFPLEDTEGMKELLEKVSRSSRASFIAVLKRLGPGSKGLLSHPFEGYTLTLDFPMRRGLIEFLHECDELVVQHGGRLYLAKDVSTTPEILSAMYPLAATFKEIKGRLDPESKLSSTLARRLRLVPDDARTTR